MAPRYSSDVGAWVSNSSEIGPLIISSAAIVF